MTRMPAISWWEGWQSRRTFDFDAEYDNAVLGEPLPGVSARFVRIETLLRMKETAGRAKDLEDIRQLKLLQGVAAMSNDRTQTDPEQAAWEAHNVSQLVYFRSLSLREKMQAVQGLADVVRRFEEMRTRGEFHVLAGGNRPGPGRNG